MSTVPGFWQRWLLIATVISAVYGLALLAFSGPMLSIYDGVLFAGVSTEARLGADAAAYIRFIFGVLGAVMTGWMSSLLVLAAGPFRRGEKSAWLAITLSVVVWFVVDSGFSLVAGYWQNAALNVGFAVIFAIPLGATFRHFFGRAG